MRAFAAALYFPIVLLSAGCVGVAPGITPVSDFELERYLGTWYEIARLDHSFERGLDKVSAEYSLRDDGGVSVVNSGFSKKDNERKIAEGKAYFVADKTTGHLKVSFFGPF
jgi:apolipoprotein D and lipocalin family protein